AAEPDWNGGQADPGSLSNENEALVAENRRLLAWVADLQSGMYVNCVYCGHRYGPSETTPVSMADALKAHIEVCPEHPMSVLREALICARNQDAFLEFPRYARELIDRALDGSV